MVLKEINEKIKEIRRQNRTCLSNIVYSKLNKEEDYSVTCLENAIAVLVKREK